jgi:hypothetical protein
MVLNALDTLEYSLIADADYIRETHILFPERKRHASCHVSDPCKTVR